MTLEEVKKGDSSVQRFHLELRNEFFFPPLLLLTVEKEGKSKELIKSHECFKIAALLPLYLQGL